MSKSKTKTDWKKIFSNQIFIPLVALILLLIVNLINDPSFFKISIGSAVNGYHVLSGSLITILDNGSELAILALGMTLVTAASGGQDISVGATIAIAGSAILRVLCGTETSPETLHAPIIVAFLVGMLAAALCGAFNGFLVAYFRIQPMVATLILYTSGRSIAAWINNNQLPTVTDESFAIIGSYIPGNPIPVPIFLAIICIVITALILKFTNIGLYTQAVGINEDAARLNGINPFVVKMFAFIFLGLCVSVAAIIKVSRVQSINYSVIASNIEMDAILAVALGGNALGGGKFNMWASVLGAYVIQMLTTTLYTFHVSSDALPAYKAIVVIILVVISSPAVRGFIASKRNKGVEVAAEEV